MPEDVVNHPSHYTQGTLEVIDAIEGMGLPYHEGNIVKYVARWRHKAGVLDLKKARWYLNRLIETEEAKQVAGLTAPLPERTTPMHFHCDHPPAAYCQHCSLWPVAPVEGTPVHLATVPKPEHYRPNCICEECVRWREAFAEVAKVDCPHHGPGEYCVSCFPAGWNLNSK